MDLDLEVHCFDVITHGLHTTLSFLSRAKPAAPLTAVPIPPHLRFYQESSQWWGQRAFQREKTPHRTSSSLSAGDELLHTTCYYSFLLLIKL